MGGLVPCPHWTPQQRNVTPSNEEKREAGESRGDRKCCPTEKLEAVERDGEAHAV